MMGSKLKDKIEELRKAAMVATVMTAGVSPSAAGNVQNMADGMQIRQEGTPTEETVSASSQNPLNVVDVKDASAEVDFGSPEWEKAQIAGNSNGDVKVVLSQQSKDAHARLSEMSDSTLQEKDNEFKEIMEKYNGPVSYHTTMSTNVGKLGEDYFGNSGRVPKTLEVPEEVRKNPHKSIKRSEVTVDKLDEALGKYDVQDNSITLAGADYAIAAGLAKEEDISGITLQAMDLYSGSYLAQYFMLLHENLHKMQDEKVGLVNCVDNPITRMQKNRLSETTATATEYLAAANMYLDFKSKGVKTLQDTRIDENGVKTTVDIPLKRILDYYPGLEEVVSKGGFDLDKKEDKRAVVEASAKHWKKEREDPYESQHVSSIFYDYDPALEYQFEMSRVEAPYITYDEAVNAMLEGVYIGGNHQLIDLTDCRNLLDTLSKEEAQKLIDEYAVDIKNYTLVRELPRETLQALDSYFTSIGLTDDKEKVGFLNGIYSNIVSRTNSDDVTQAVKDILLANGGTITYGDGLIETRYPNTGITTIQNGVDGEKFVMNADVDFSRGAGRVEQVNTAETTTKSAEQSTSNKTTTSAITSAMLNAGQGR